MPTINSGFWGGTYSLISKGQAEIRLRKLFRKGNAQVIGELAKELTGSSVGANTAQVIRKRVKGADGFTSRLGGKREIENYTLINRATTAADETLVDSIVQPKRFAPITYPGDKSGNGK